MIDYYLYLSMLINKIKYLETKNRFLLPKIRTLKIGYNQSHMNFFFFFFRVSESTYARLD